MFISQLLLHSGIRAFNFNNQVSLHCLFYTKIYGYRPITLTSLSGAITDVILHNIIFVSNQTIGLDQCMLD